MLAVILTSACLSAEGSAGRSDSSQPRHLSTIAALQQYARGDRDIVAVRVTGGLPPIETMADELFKISRWFRLAGPAGPRTSREVAAFSVEIARYFGNQAGSTACLLIASGRTRWLDHERTTVFARTWHAAAIATLLRLDCPSQLEKEIDSALRAFPREARFQFARAVAAEQRLASNLANGDAPTPGDIRDLDSYFQAALTSVSVRHEAALHWARVNILLRHHPDVIRFADIAVQSPDRDVQYLAHLLRGRALSQLGEAERADDSFVSALALVPNAQTAMLARATARFGQRDADSAEKIMSSFLEAGSVPLDPWWTYAMGDGRFVDRLIGELRAQIER